MMKSSILILVLTSLFLTASLKGQSRNDIRIYPEAGKNGEYTFFAENLIAKETHIVIIFDNLSQHRADVSLPFQKTIRSGKTRLFKLTPIATAQPNWQYRAFFYRGVGNPKVAQVEYALPAEVGEEVKVRGTTKLSNPTDATDLEEYYGISFYANKVRALRGGQINVIKVDSRKASDNYVRIRHKDGTVGTYHGIKIGTLTLELDEFIKAGEVLGDAEAPNDETPFFNFSASYMKVVVDDNGPTNAESRSFNRYMVPMFRTDSGERMRLEGGNTYTAVLPLDLITQEMSKREKKKYLKRKKG